MRNLKMKAMSRAIILCLVLSMILGTGLFVFADSGPVITVNAPSAAISAGKSFTVTVDISGNPGFCSMQFVLQYDSSLMECTSMSSGTVLKGAMCVTNPSASDGARVAMAAVNPATGNGTLVSCTFTAKKDISSANFTIGDFLLSDTNGKDISCTVNGAKISAAETPSNTTPASTPDTGNAGNSDNEPKEETGTSEKTDASTETHGLPIVRTEVPEFKDTQKHWAKDYIAEAYQKGIVNGYDDTEFGPDDEVTRAQFVVTLYRICGSPEVNASSSFKDISGQSYEFQKAITWAKSMGYVNGVSDTEFAPNLAITRQEMVTMLFNFSGKKQGGELMFTSIYKSAYNDYGQLASWAQNAAGWAIYNEYLSGTSPTTLSPTETASRAEMAKILLSYTDKNY